MALFQVGFFVLPKESLKDHIGFNLSNEGLFDDAQFWKKRLVSPDFFCPIEKILPRGKSWANYLHLYGNENENRFEVVFENDIVESVTFRIDFTGDFEGTLSMLIEFFIFNDLIVLDEDLSLITLNLESFKGTIQNAPQVEKYFRLLKEK